MPFAAELQSRALPDLQQALVEVAGFGPFKVMFIPASNFEPEATLPSVRMDVFYDRRVLDMPDGLPKYSGYFPSELAIGKMIMAGL